MAGEDLHPNNDFIVDTGILIRYLKKIRRAADLLDFLEQIGTVKVSTITYMEILIGCQPHEEESTKLLFERIPQQLINQDIVEKAVFLIKKYQDIFMKDNRGKDYIRQYPDAIIAATAWQQQGILVTLNKKQFGKTNIKEFTLKLINQEAADWVKQLNI